MDKQNLGPGAEADDPGRHERLVAVKDFGRIRKPS